MNTTTILATILSIFLAAAAAGNPAGTNATANVAAPPGHNLNHNETFVQDTASYQTPDVGSLGLTPEQATTVAPFLIRLAYTGANCSPLVCGSNHNETLLHDAR